MLLQVILIMVQNATTGASCAHRAEHQRQKLANANEKGPAREQGKILYDHSQT